VSKCQNISTGKLGGQQMIIIARCTGFPETDGNAIATFYLFHCRNFRIPGFQSLETYDAMNWRKFVSPWLRGSMRFRSLDCEGADEGAR
jgi:hypothetical protein